MTLTKADWQARAAALKPETRLFIDGEFVAAADGGTFATINPATGEALAEVARGRAADVDRAVASARRAFRDGRWSRMDPRGRMEVLARFADLVEAHAEDFALLDTLDMGKPISDMLAIDVPGSVSNLRFFAEVVDKMEGAVTNTTASALHYVLRQPMGVCAIVVPWNYPLMMAAWKLGPALATGNSVVLKPAEQSPLSALLLARLFVEAGGPAGVLNVVTGLGEEAGKPLALHMGVEKIAFTGSTEVGKLMFVYSGQSNMKRVTTECGGKSPQIVLADCHDLDRAARVAVSASSAIRARSVRRARVCWSTAASTTPLSRNSPKSPPPPTSRATPWTRPRPWARWSLPNSRRGCCPMSTSAGTKARG